MKNLKSYLQLSLALFFILGISTTTIGQKEMKEYKMALSSGTLNIVDIDGVEIQGYNGTDIVISSEVETNHGNNRAQGLKLINSLGLDDNTGFGIAMTKEGNTVTARQISQNCSCDEVFIKVPQNVSIVIGHGGHDAERIVVKDVSSELEITTNYHDVSLRNVTGPMAVKTVYGEIEATFKSLSQNGSISIYSVYDLVDVTVPSNAGLNLTASASYGNVYSNAVIKVDESVKSASSSSCSSGGTTIVGKVNGGGVDFNVKSAYEDVYIRQN